MKKQLQNGKSSSMKFAFVKNKVLLIIAILLLFSQGKAQVGTWAQILNDAPHNNHGVALLLTDGSVIATTNSYNNGYLWDKLTPDINGSYINGSWTTIAPMQNQRYGFSSQVLKDGRVYIAGSEYGSAANTGEIYNPQNDTWIPIPNPLNLRFGEANSMMLPDGTILQGLKNEEYPVGTFIFHPGTSTFTLADSTHLGSIVEAPWVLLPDHSILMVDYPLNPYVTERYIPSLQQWIADTPTPVDLYGNSVEIGPSIMLPDGRAFFLGASGHTAYYTPSGTAAPGTWTAGPDIPDNMGTLDAPASMMANGKILFAASPLPDVSNSYSEFNTPTNFYEYDPTAGINGVYTQTTAPGISSNQWSQFSNLLNLPDGSVLLSDASLNYYVYSPVGSTNNLWKPTIATINPITQIDCNNFTITGTQFNGMSQGSAFGDDWQMATNYPIISLTSGANVYYVQTHDWDNTGVQTGALATSTNFTVPLTVPSGTYSLQVIANGIPSDPYTFVYNVPTLTNLPSLAICSGNNFIYSPTSSSNGATITWVRNAVTGINNGSGSGTQSSSINETLTNSTSIPINVIYDFTINTTSCILNQQVIVTVNPTVTVTASSLTVCPNTTVTLTANGSSSYTWSAGATSTGTTTATVTPAITTTYSVTGVNSLCSSFNSANITVTVEEPTTGPYNAVTLCSGNTTSIPLISSITGSTFTYTATLFSGTATGFSGNSGSPIAQLLINNTTAPAVVKYTITPISPLGCYLWILQQAQPQCAAGHL